MAYITADSDEQGPPANGSSATALHSSVTGSGSSGKSSVLRRTCDLCTIRKRRCTGTNPCALCAARGKVCEYSMCGKRGPKPKPPDAAATTAAANDAVANDGSSSSSSRSVPAKSAAALVRKRRRRQQQRPAGAAAAAAGTAAAAAAAAALTLPDHPRLHTGQLLGLQELRYLQNYLLAFSAAGFAPEADVQRAAMHLMTHGNDDAVSGSAGGGGGGGGALSKVAAAVARRGTGGARPKARSSGNTAAAIPLAAHKSMMWLAVASGAAMSTPVRHEEVATYMACAYAALEGCGEEPVLPLLRAYVMMALTHGMLEDYAGLFAYYHRAINVARAILHARSAKGGVSSADAGAGVSNGDTVVDIDDDTWVVLEVLRVSRIFAMSYVENDRFTKRFVRHRLLTTFQRIAPNPDEFRDIGQGTPGMLFTTFSPSIEGLPDLPAQAAAEEAKAPNVAQPASVSRALRELGLAETSRTEGLVHASTQGGTRAMPVVFSLDHRVMQVMHIVNTTPFLGSLAAAREAGARVQRIVERLTEGLGGDFMTRPSLMQLALSYMIIFLRLLCCDEEGTMEMLLALVRNFCNTPGMLRVPSWRHNVHWVAAMLASADRHFEYAALARTYNGMRLAGGRDILPEDAHSKAHLCCCSHFRCAATARVMADNLSRGAASVFTRCTLLHVPRAQVDAIDLSCPPAPMYVSLGRAMHIKLYNRRGGGGGGAAPAAAAAAADGESIDEDEGVDAAPTGGPINLAAVAVRGSDDVLPPPPQQQQQQQSWQVSQQQQLQQPQQGPRLHLSLQPPQLLSLPPPPSQQQQQPLQGWQQQQPQQGPRLRLSLQPPLLPSLPPPPQQQQQQVQEYQCSSAAAVHHGSSAQRPDGAFGEQQQQRAFVVAAEHSGRSGNGDDSFKPPQRQQQCSPAAALSRGSSADTARVHLHHQSHNWTGAACAAAAAAPMLLTAAAPYGTWQQQQQQLPLGHAALYPRVGSFDATADTGDLDHHLPYMHDPPALAHREGLGRISGSGDGAAHNAFAAAATGAVPALDDDRTSNHSAFKVDIFGRKDDAAAPAAADSSRASADSSYRGSAAGSVCGAESDSYTSSYSGSHSGSYSYDASHSSGSCSASNGHYFAPTMARTSTVSLGLDGDDIDVDEDLLAQLAEELDSEDLLTMADTCFAPQGAAAAAAIAAPANAMSDVLPVYVQQRR